MKNDVAICRSAAVILSLEGRHSVDPGKSSALRAGVATADQQFPLSIRGRWNLPNSRKDIVDSVDYPDSHQFR